jgi:hypothetical protein
MWGSDRHMYVLVRSLRDPSRLRIANSQAQAILTSEDEELLSDIIAHMVKAQIPIVEKLPW